MLEIYKASVKNVKEVKKQAKVIKKLLNQALKENRVCEIDALTKTYALMYSAYAEVSFQKLIHTPHGFSDDYIQQIEEKRNLTEKWEKCMELAIKQIENGGNKGEIANKLKWLNKIMNNYIVHPSQIRNKIAHGQWSVCLNNNCTNINNDMTNELDNLDFVKVEKLFTIYEIFVQCVEDLIESPYKAHYRDFYSKLSELDAYVEKTKDYTMESKKNKLQSSIKYKTFHEKYVNGKM